MTYLTILACLYTFQSSVTPTNGELPHPPSKYTNFVYGLYKHPHVIRNPKFKVHPNPIRRLFFITNLRVSVR